MVEVGGDGKTVIGVEERRYEGRRGQEEKKGERKDEVKAMI